MLALAAAALAPAAAWFIDAKMSRDVILLTPAPPEIVELNRMMWSKGEPVAKIYGEPVDRPVRVVRPDPRDLIVPAEDPSMTLMNAGGERHPLQVQSVWYVAKLGAMGALVFGLVIGGAAWVLKRRRQPSA